MNKVISDTDQMVLMRVCTARSRHYIVAEACSGCAMLFLNDKLVRLVNSRVERRACPLPTGTLALATCVLCEYSSKAACWTSKLIVSILSMLGLFQKLTADQAVPAMLPLGPCILY